MEVCVLRRQAPADDLSLVTALHCQAFPDGVTTRLGLPFVGQYYRSLVGSAGGLLVVARAAGKVVGFLAGTTDRRGFERAHRTRPGARAAVLRMLRLQLNPLSILRAVLKRHQSRHVADPAELVSIALATDARGSGIGSALVAAWVRELIDAGIPSYVVYTDNADGIRFYERKGGECVFKFHLGRMTSACYRFRVAGPADTG
ncbi:MAG: GNAT family N-acetyltransferase [Phycisphaerae bacterium]|nr:GNAT family N-acetyltransferase [Phycisphaerae bacterium]